MRKATDITRLADPDTVRELAINGYDKETQTQQKQLVKSWYRTYSQKPSARRLKLKQCAKFIKETRLRTGLTVAEIAHFLKVKPNTVSQFECGRNILCFTTILKYCALIGMTRNELGTCFYSALQDVIDHSDP